MYNLKLDRKIKQLKELSKKLIKLFDETICMQADEFVYGNNFKVLNDNYGNVHSLSQFEALYPTANVPYKNLEPEATQLLNEAKERKTKFSKESEEWLYKNCLTTDGKIRALTFDDVQSAFDAGAEFEKKHGHFANNQEMTIDEKIKARKAFQKELHEELDSVKPTKDQVQKVFDM